MAQADRRLWLGVTVKYGTGDRFRRQSAQTKITHVTFTSYDVIFLWIKLKKQIAESIISLYIFSPHIQCPIVIISV